MSATNYVGIDYGMGMSNVDKANGIRFGVISQHSLGEWINDVIFDGADYGQPTCPSCGNTAISSDDVSDEISEADWFDHKDYTCIACEECFWSDNAFSDEMLGWSHESDGYKLTDCLTNDVFVLASPYYTYAQYCSPCVPGAGNLDSPIDIPVCPECGGLFNIHVTLNFYQCVACKYRPHTEEIPELDAPKVYALGHEWFEEHKAPYRVFRVIDGTEVFAEGQDNA